MHGLAVGLSWATALALGSCLCLGRLPFALVHCFCPSSMALAYCFGPGLALGGWGVFIGRPPWGGFFFLESKIFSCMRRK